MNRRTWSAADDAVLAEHYPDGGGIVCGRLLDGWDTHAINRRASLLGIKRKFAAPTKTIRQPPVPWTLTERERLAQLHASDASIKAIAEALGRPLSSARAQVLILERGNVEPSAPIIDRLPHQDTADAHIAWQEMDWDVKATPAANGPMFSPLGVAA